MCSGAEDDIAFSLSSARSMEGDDPLGWRAAGLSRTITAERHDLRHAVSAEQVTERAACRTRQMVRRLRSADGLAPDRRGSAQTSGKTKPDSVARTERRAYGGLDLGSTTDLTGTVLMIRPLLGGEPWLCVPFARLPDGSAAPDGPR